jgi:hypothetical protein
MEDAFTSFDGVKQLNEKEIDKMRMDFGGRTAANGRIGTNRTKNIKAVIHWLMDFDRVSERPSIAGLSGRACKSQLKTAMTRAQVRSTLSSKNISDAADPGPLKSEKQWKEWEEKFSNYLRCISIRSVLSKNNTLHTQIKITSNSKQTQHKYTTYTH